MKKEEEEEKEEENGRVGEEEGRKRWAEIDSAMKC